jgi:hypothetical protein
LQLDCPSHWHAARVHHTQLSSGVLGLGHNNMRKAQNHHPESVVGVDGEQL